MKQSLNMQIIRAPIRGRRKPVVLVLKEKNVNKDSELMHQESIMICREVINGIGQEASL